MHIRLFFLPILIAVFATIPASAQKFAYVDSDFILSKISEYQSAQTQIDNIANTWKTEIDNKYKVIERKYQTYQAEQFLLDDDSKLKRQQDIEALEQEVKQLQNQRFGYEGDLFKKREELIKPIQDKVFNAISQLAKSKKLDFIFDKAVNANLMLFVNPEFDLSDEVLKKINK